MQHEKRPEYHWETSEALYELFCILAIWKKTRQLTVKELSEITKKELRLVAEQVRFLEKEKIITSEKKRKK
jgi:hypothetical protein